MPGRIVAIQIARAAGAPMQALTTAHLVPGRGIEGDRFYARRAANPTVDANSSDVTLVEQAALNTLADIGVTETPDFTARRNIVVSGLSLHALIGQSFRIGPVTLLGLPRLHGSCASETSDQHTACAALGDTTLWARVLTEGAIAVGDPVEGVNAPQLAVI